MRRSVRRFKLTLGLRFSAVDALEVRLTNALTTFASSVDTPPRKFLRIRSSFKISLILLDLRSNSRRSFLRDSASGCHSPPPVNVRNHGVYCHTIGAEMSFHHRNDYKCHGTRRAILTHEAASIRLDLHIIGSIWAFAACPRPSR